MRAYVGMRIPATLPLDFAFIGHETTVQEVLERAGPSTREIEFYVTPEEVIHYPLVETKSGHSAIRILEYELPYFGVVRLNGS